MTPVADRLRLAQEKAGLSNRELARRMGVSVELVARWREGRRRPNWAHLARLGVLLDRDPAWFLAGEGVEA